LDSACISDAETTFQIFGRFFLGHKWNSQPVANNVHNFWTCWNESQVQNLCTLLDSALSGKTKQRNWTKIPQTYTQIPEMSGQNCLRSWSGGVHSLDQSSLHTWASLGYGLMKGNHKKYIDLVFGLL
jgi:hypothetical protein